MKKAKHLKRPKFEGHLNLAKGGAVVQKFAQGGTAAPIATQPTAISAPPVNTLAGPGSGGVNTTAATGAGQTGLIGSISDALGTQNNFQGQAANITPGTNTEQLNTAYQGVQNSLGQQGQLANQLAPQVGSAVNNQNVLADQYAAMTRGEGPNPAQMQLNQATAANVANQAALMAGQRGASANPALLARQAAMQGAQTQQQAAGQAATLGAEQQIAAQQNLAALSNNQVAQAGNAVGAAGAAQQNEQNILQNANTGANNAAVGMQSNINNVNAQTASGNQQNAVNTAAGVGQALSNIPVVGNVLGGLFAHGGQVPAMADGGQISPSPIVGAPAPQDQWLAPVFNQSSASNGPSIPATAANAPLTAGSSDGDKKEESPAKTLTAGDVSSLAMLAYSGGRIAKGPHRSHVANFLAGGGQVGDVKAIVSPKEVYLAPAQVHKVIHEGADPMKIGHHFPGQDKVKGRDSKKNDVIPTTLRAGGVVIPVHITTHKKASERGRKFVARTMAKHMKRPAGAK